MSTFSITNNDLFRLSMASSIAVLLFALLIGMIHPLGYLILLLIPVILTIKSGVEFDFENSRYRKFKAVLGTKRGEWKKYTAQHELVLLKKHGAKSIVNPAFLSERSIEDYFYELYLMDQSHIKRLFLYSTKEKQKADTVIQQITGNSEILLVPFNPVSAWRR